MALPMERWSASQTPPKQEEDAQDVNHASPPSAPRTTTESNSQMSPSGHADLWVTAMFEGPDAGDEPLSPTSTPRARSLSSQGHELGLAESSGCCCCSRDEPQGSRPNSPGRTRKDSWVTRRMSKRQLRDEEPEAQAPVLPEFIAARIQELGAVGMPSSPGFLLRQSRVGRGREDAVAKEGYLNKSGEVNTSLKKRWIVLRGDVLRYYDKELGMLKGQIIMRRMGQKTPLADNKGVVTEVLKTGDFEVELVCQTLSENSKKSRRFTLQVPKENHKTDMDRRAEAHEWHEVLLAAVRDPFRHTMIGTRSGKELWEFLRPRVRLVVSMNATLSLSAFGQESSRFEFKDKVPCFMRHPKSRFSVAWDVLQIFCILYVAWILPLRVGLQQETHLWSSGFVAA